MTKNTSEIPKSTPTSEQFGAYQAMYDYFNAELFSGSLSPVILNFSRLAKSYGFFAPKRWGQADVVRHEISLNPSYLADRPAKATVSTLVHEMAHAWQQEHGKPGRGRYHNSEWADKMEAIGLMPTNTGEPGGARVGDRVTHMIVEGGLFDLAFERMPASYLLPWSSSEPDAEKKTRPNSKVKYTCEGCEANAWAKPGANLMCGDCEEQMEPASA